MTPDESETHRELSFWGNVAERRGLGVHQEALRRYRSIRSIRMMHGGKIRTYLGVLVGGDCHYNNPLPTCATRRQLNLCLSV